MFSHCCFRIFEMKQVKLFSFTQCCQVSALIENPTEEPFKSMGFTRRGGGIFREILDGGVPPGFQILTLFQTKKNSFPTLFWIRMLLFLSVFIGIETTVTFVHFPRKPYLIPVSSLYPFSDQKGAKIIPLSGSTPPPPPHHHLNECTNFKNNLSFNI